MIKFFRRRLHRPDRGAVLVVAVPALVMAIAAAALGVDIGRIALDRRNDQKVADLAALDAARAIGFILNTTNQAGYQSAAQTAAVASAARNNFVSGTGGRTITATIGSIDSNNVFQSTGSSAVRVVASSYLAYAFRPGGRTVSATGVAFVGNPIAAFSVGSQLVSLNTNRAYLDPLLKGMLGASAALTAVSYDGLATGNVALSALQTALLANNIQVGTVDQLLNTNIKVTDLLSATATALGASTATTEINDLLAANLSSTAVVKLADLLDVATPSDSAVLASKINVFQMVNGAAQLANGQNFASLGTGISLGSLATMDASVKVVSPAQTGIGPVGTTAANSQAVIRLGLDLKVGLLGSLVHVQLDYTTGSASGTLNSIVCGTPSSVGVTANSSAATVTATASTAITGTLTLTPSTIGAYGPTNLTFNGPTYPTATQRIPNSTTGLGSTSIGVAATGNILVNLVLAVLNPLANVLSSALTSAATLLNPVLKAIGVDVGGADVTALGIFPDPTSCGGHPRIAQ